MRIEIVRQTGYYFLCIAYEEGRRDVIFLVRKFQRLQRFISLQIDFFYGQCHFEGPIILEVPREQSKWIQYDSFRTHPLFFSLSFPGPVLNVRSLQPRAITHFLNSYTTNQKRSRNTTRIKLQFLTIRIRTRVSRILYYFKLSFQYNKTSFRKLGNTLLYN